MNTFDEVRQHWLFQCAVAWVAIGIIFCLLPSLNVAKVLLILAVIAGEVALFSERRELQRVFLWASGGLLVASGVGFLLIVAR